jgi:hypothetical protein
LRGWRRSHRPWRGADRCGPAVMWHTRPSAFPQVKLLPRDICLPIEEPGIQSPNTS